MLGPRQAKVYELAELRKEPIVIEAVQRFDALFAIERVTVERSQSKRSAISAG